MVHGKNHLRVTYEYIRATYGWHTRTYEWHTDNIRDVPVTYGWHTSIYKWLTYDIRVDTSDIRMTYEYIRVTCEWYTSDIRVYTIDIRITYEYHTIDMWITGADAGILKRGGRALRIGDEGGPTIVGARCQKILKIRPPRLAKNAFAQCYIKLSFIAEIR